MKKKISAGLILLLIAMFISGCTSVPVIMVPEPMASVDDPIDMSIYYAVDEVPEPNIVPLDEELQYIDTEHLMRLMRLNNPSSQLRTSYDQYIPEWNLVLVDSRPPAKYGEGHINGAINIPDAQFHDLAYLLPEDKDKMLIFYCGGLECALSPNSAKKAMELGYTNVHVYREGTPFWEEAGNYFAVTAEYVSSLITSERVDDMEAKPVMLIDSRPYDVYFNGHIPGALSMDDKAFVQKYLASMPIDKGTEIITYCGGFFCGLSHNSARILVNNGYTNVKVLAGGVPAWKEAGLPLFGLEAGDSDFDITGGKPSRKINTADFRNHVNAGTGVVIDVRNDTERATGAIKGSIHIPDSEIHADPNAIADRLPANKNATLLIHCASGARACGVVDKIAELGYPNTFCLDNRIVIDADGNFSF